jgi:predicted transcriptional regulator
MPESSITIRTDAELAAKVMDLANAMDRSRNWVIEEAIRQYVATQAWQIEGIQEAVKSLDRGESIPHDQVVAEMDALLAKYANPQ